MKTHHIVLSLLFLTTGGLFAQEVKNKSSFKTKFVGGKKIVLNLESAQVSIEGYNGDEVIIEAENPPQIPEEAKGLRPLSAGGTDNTGLGVAAVTNNGTMTISTVLKNNDSNEPTKYRFKIPRQLSVSYKQGSGWGNGDEKLITVVNIDGEVDIKTNNTNIELTNVTGPIVAKSNDGKIKVIYDDKISEKPSSFISYDGNIDITVSEKAKVAFGVNTGYGSRSNVFTDLDLKTVTTSEKKDIQATKIDVSFNSKNPPTPRKPNEMRIIASKVTVKDTISNREISITDSTGGPLDKVIDMAMELNDMSMDIASDELSELSDLSNANDYGKKSTSYVLNDGKTKITVRTSSGNVFLRKK